MIGRQRRLWTATTSDGRHLEFNFAERSITATYLAGGRISNTTAQIVRSSPSPILYDYLVEALPGYAARTCGNVINAVQQFDGFLAMQGNRGLTAAAYSEFLSWMQDFLEESSRRGYGLYVRDAYLHAMREGLIVPGEYAQVAQRHHSAFRGFSKRAELRAQAREISHSEVKSLLTAIDLEIREAETHLKRFGADAYRRTRSVLPVLMFPLLAALLQGLRAAEWNALDLEDISQAEGWIYAHAPNKRDGYLLLLPELDRAWRVSLAWQACYRESWEPGSPAVLVPLGMYDTNPQLVRLLSGSLGYQLGKFYRKYFKLTQPDGTPVLFAGDDPSKPAEFSLPFQEYRAASITEYARFEKDPEKVRTFARHGHFSSTRRYLRPTTQELQESQVHALASRNEQLRLRVLGRVAATGEIEVALEKQALVPGGACGGPLMADQLCTKSIDCRLCGQFIIDPRKREYFVLSAARNKELAAGLHLQNNPREREVYLNLAGIDEAIVEVIDLHLCGLL